METKSSWQSKFLSIYESLKLLNHCGLRSRLSRLKKNNNNEYVLFLNMYFHKRKGPGCIDKKIKNNGNHFTNVQCSTWRRLIYLPRKNLNWFNICAPQSLINRCKNLFQGNRRKLWAVSGKWKKTKLDRDEFKILHDSSKKG